MPTEPDNRPYKLTLNENGVIVFEGQWNDEMHKTILIFAQDCIAYGMTQYRDAVDPIGAYVPS